MVSTNHASSNSAQVNILYLVKIGHGALYQEPSQTRVDWGQSPAGLRPGWPGIKNGEATATGPARPGLAAVGWG